MVYAMQVKKADLGLITMLNDGPPPNSVLNSKKETYLVFEIDAKGKNVWTAFATKREMFDKYDMYARAPFILRLKEVSK